MASYFQLNEFARKVGKHYTTVNEWFNRLESNKIHYVARSEIGEKIYDEMDLKIGKFIHEKRKEQWNIQAIFNVLADQQELELRDVPTHQDNQEDDRKPVTVNQIKAMMQQELTEQIAVSIREELTEQIAESIREVILQTLPPAPPTIDPEQQRLQRLNDMMTHHRIDSKLHIEALEEWSKIPKEERFIKTGFFRKEEDVTKRDLFIQKYKTERYDSMLRAEFLEN